jgi:DNA replication protein DnaC
MLHQTIEKLHALKLAAMADGLLAQTRQPDIDALGFEERLALLVDLQHTAAQNAALGQRLKASRLRQTACLEDLDLRTPRGLDRALIQTLASCQWLRTARSVLVLGPTGVGKTFLACALGHQAAREGFSVLYRRLPHLLDDLAIARVAGRHRQLFARLARIRLLILDDWALVRLTAEQRRDLMEVIDDRHDRAATLLASQIPVDRWFEQIGDATYADAILDRIVHTAYRIELRGDAQAWHGEQRGGRPAGHDADSLIGTLPWHADDHPGEHGPVKGGASAPPPAAALPWTDQHPWANAPPTRQGRGMHRRIPGAAILNIKQQGHNNYDVDD